MEFVFIALAFAGGAVTGVFMAKSAKSEVAKVENAAAALTAPSSSTTPNTTSK